MRRFGAVPLALSLALVLTSCRDAKLQRPASILLITLDTTRADHLGCYGDAKAATPTLDAFSKEAVRFDQAMSAVPNTLPSHCTMFTGVYPPVHGVRYNGMFKLGEASVTIAERLRDAGFVTGAVPSAYPVYAKSGLSQGFDTYKDLFSEPGAEKLEPTAERPASDVTRLGLETIKNAAGKPFFVWLHYYDAHLPYKPPFPYSSRFREHPYDGEIAYVDSQLGELFAALRTQGLWDGLCVVVAGDHGEGLFEHGEHMHSQLTYQSTLRVPLMVKTPGAKRGLVVAEPVTLADLAPTILDLAGLPVPGGLDGISLAGALAGRALPRRELYFETLSGALNFGWSPIEGLRRGKWKLIRSGDAELYDLDSDPGENADLSATDPAIVADLTAALDNDLARWSKTAAPAVTTVAPIDPAARNRLASLGYIGGTMTTASRGGPSPRKMVHLESELLLLQDVMAQRLFTNALASTTNVLRDDPGNRFALNAAADSSLALHDFDATRRYGKELLTRYPDFVPGILTQGRLSIGLKDYKSAESYFREGLAKNPAEPVLVYSLALTLVAENRSADAEPLLRKALEKPGTDPAFRVVLAVCRAIAGDAPAAKSELAQALAAGYKDEQTLRGEPLLAPLRKIPGFEQVLAAKKAP